MPDRVVLLRPTVQVDAATVTPHPSFIDFQNGAVRVQQDPTDAGVVQVRVGYGLNADVTLGVETTAAGGGNHATLTAGAAVGVGPSNGGNVYVAAGAGAGAAAGHGGGVQIDGGASSGTGTGGTVSLFGGTGVGGPGGAVAIIAGQGAAGLGGATSVQGGSGTTGGGGLMLAGGPRTAGVGAGANVTVQPGLGFGGGATGAIVLDDQGTAMSVLPTTTNLVTLGSTTLGLAGVYTRLVQADTGQILSVKAANGTVVETVGSTGLVTQVVNRNFPDQVNLIFGGANDVLMRWSTAQATANSMLIGVAVGTAGEGGNVILTTAANMNKDHDRAVASNPTFYIFSATDPDSANTQFLRMYHDGTNGTITTGGLFLNIGGGSQGCRLRSGAVTLLTVDGTLGAGSNYQFDAPTKVSGSVNPALLFTAGAHSGIAVSEAIDQHWNNGRTVTFTTGGGVIAMQRSVVFEAPTYAAGAATTITNPATVYIAGPPAAGSNMTFTNGPYTLWIDDGDVRLDGQILSGGGAQVICDAAGVLHSAGGANFGPAPVASITVVDGIVTAIS